MVVSYLHDKASVIFEDELLEHIEQKNNDKVELILQEAKNLYNAVDAKGASLLHYAAEFGNERITQFLINWGADRNLRNKDGDTPLLLATKKEHIDTIKVLLESDADIHICDKEGASALQVAVQTSPTNVKIARLFLYQLGNDCLFDSRKIAKRLMKVNCPFHVAAELFRHPSTNIRQLASWMLVEGCHIDARDTVTGKTALHVAVENVDCRSVWLLTKNFGPDVNAKDSSGRTPLATLKDFSYPSTVELITRDLVKAKTKLTSCDNDGFMQMRAVLQYGSNEAVKNVLESYLFDVAAKDEHKQTAIHYLAMNRYPGIVEVVEKQIDMKKVDVNDRDEAGLTALHIAASVGNASFVEFLVKKGASVLVTCKNGSTPFSQTVESEARIDERARCVKLLLRDSHHSKIYMGHYFRNRSTKSAINRDFALLEPVVADLAIRKAVDDFPTDEIEILQKIYSHPKLNQCFEECTTELEKMRSDVIHKDVTVLDMIALNHNYCNMRYDSIPFSIKGPWIKMKPEKYRSITIYHEILEERVSPLANALKVFLVCYASVCVGIFAGMLLNYFTGNSDIFPLAVSVVTIAGMAFVIIADQFL